MTTPRTQSLTRAQAPASGEQAMRPVDLADATIGGPTLRQAALPLLIFLVVALVALGAAWALWESAEGRDRARFDVESRVASLAVSERIERQTALLRGAAGLFAAEPNLSAFSFDAYADRLGSTESYPGVLGLGYAPHLRGPAERDAFVTRMRLTAASDFRVRPEGERGEYLPIMLLSPLSRPNRDTIGYDMLYEPVRRAAVERARDEGRVASTGPVILLQDARAGRTPGFLLYLPVYRGGRVPITASGRARDFQGVVYNPIRANDFWEDVFSSRELRQVDVAIYDRDVAPENLLYQTGPVDPGAARFSSTVAMEVAGRSWIIATATRSDFTAGSQRWLPWWIGGLGTLTALLLALAARSQARASLVADRARAELRVLNETLESRVETRTAELSTAYAGLSEEVERRQGAEEQVRQMQKMEAVGQLTGGIAHDFNNMLAIVIGSLDMAKRRSDDPGRVARLIDNAMEGATRAASLTQRLLAFARRQPLSPERVEINALVVGMTELIRRTSGETIQLDVRLAPEAWGALVDVSQLENAVLNLAVNARDAMPVGGSLVIETVNRTLEADASQDAAPGDYVVISVTDSGEGMTPEVLAKAFEPFFTTKGVGKGTGLGLSQVFGFIRQSGGHVKIDSEVGRGTSVHLFLPRHDTSGDERAELGPGGTRVPRGKADELILVVEDEESVRLMSVEALRELGYMVLHESTGAAALDKLRRNIGVRLLITDVVMPEMNGRELADAARLVSPEIRLLFTTGYTRDALATPDATPDDVELLAKPFTLAQLAVKVRHVLDV